jgi:hypothetical protein
MKMGPNFRYDPKVVGRKGQVFKLLFITFFFVLLGMSVNTEAETQWPKYISLSSSAGTQWTVAVGMSAQIQKYTGVGSSALGPTSGTETNLRNLKAKKAELALNSNPAITEAWTGTGPFKEDGPQKWLRTISRTWVTNFYIIASKKSGIKIFEDLKGKRWGDLYVGSSMTVSLLKGLKKIHHMTENDYKSLPASDYAGFVAMLKEGRADAVSFFGGIPSPQALDLNSSMEITFISLSKEAQARLPEEAPGYSPGIIPANSYKGQDKDVAVAQTLMTFMTSQSIDNEVIYGICKALFDHPEELEPIHPNFKEFARKPISKYVTVPYHEGAIKYYKEKGLWNEELEVLQKKLLSN